MLLRVVERRPVLAAFKSMPLVSYMELREAAWMCAKEGYAHCNLPDGSDGTYRCDIVMAEHLPATPVPTDENVVVDESGNRFAALLVEYVCCECMLCSSPWFSVCAHRESQSHGGAGVAPRLLSCKQGRRCRAKSVNARGS